MRSALAICREYGQPPAWWEGLDTEYRALLLADHQMRAPTRGR